MSAKDNRSLDEIEMDIARNRDSLAATIDELAFRVKPANVAKRQTAEAKSALYAATHGPDGSLRYDVVGAAAGVAILLVTVAIVRRVRR
ncbi:DUF3618 domain-containing protein [Mobilicoccus caccae]|uniref:DUF3618 domain-containing protein n=1 Tax=Mobilicoccus caccae TaxID=1859295 RepID=A0ABQ6IM87_9MICO|nr:DUF3618 domain-containing protein [Mobilicoccus caccae]GMA39055.1 hypothetical protein GCM10025883_11000 [Mobilicoccus caccae]